MSRLVHCITLNKSVATKEPLGFDVGISARLPIHRVLISIFNQDRALRRISRHRGKCKNSTFNNIFCYSPLQLMQNFWDAETDTEFHYNREESSWNPHWWYGEPVSFAQLLPISPAKLKAFAFVWMDILDVGNC